LSFESLGDLATACGSSEDTFNFDYVGLGTAVGISPKLISQIVHNSDRHYRRFLIPKKSGGVRSIDSPRIFLKVLQWFIMDYLLPDIPIHGSVTSFVPGKSVVTNAMPHCRKAYVGSIDIEQFFPSLTIELVSKLFIENGYNEIEAFVLSKLVTKRGCLPQGAPTSPTLSNALLYRFDEQMTDYCAVGGMSYSRYADDITISGNAGARIQAALLHAKRTLHAHYNLRINEKKTRIRSQGSQQRVTGVVVNEEPAPPRVYRRKIRAIFHGALNQPHEYVGRLDELAGYVGHLDMFPKISGSKDIREYKAVLEKLRAIQNLQ
ncbi:MAG: reverse transcriptase domain-containing protein, partial [Alphaproteobacteria bacterium]